MPKTVSVIHTGPVTLDPLGRLINEVIAGVRVINIVDDSLLKDVMAADGVTKQVARRLCQYMKLSQDMGADAILNACSSVGEVVDIARNLVDIPIIKIDEAMAKRAVMSGRTIGVIATVKTTLDPTARLIESKAREHGRTISVAKYLCSNAFEALLSGDSETHDQLLLNLVARTSDEADVIVLAQASMARLISRIPCGIKAPVLTSPRLGVEDLKKALFIS